MTSRELLDVNFAQRIDATQEFPVALRSAEAVKHQRAVVKRETARYVPQNSNYTQGQTMYLKVTSDQALMVPSSARLRFRLTNNLAAGAGDMAFPNLVTSIFDRAQLWMGGQLVDDIPRNAGLATWVVAQQTMSRDYYDNDALYTLRNGAAVVDDDDGTAYFEVPLSLLFGSFRQYKYLPLRNMENGIEIRLKLDDSKDAMHLSADIAPLYTIDNIELFGDLVYLDEAVAQSMDTLIQAGQQKLVYPVHTWYVDSRAGGAAAGVEVQFNRSTSHCRNLIFFHRLDTNINDADAQFKLNRDGASDLRIQIGGVSYPQYDKIADSRSAWSITRSSLGLLGHVNSTAGLLHKTAATVNAANCGYAAADSDYEVDGFSLVWSFEKMRETEDLDSDAMNITGMPIIFRETVGANAKTVYMIMEYTRFVVIGSSLVTVEE